MNNTTTPLISDNTPTIITHVLLHERIPTDAEALELLSFNIDVSHTLRQWRPFHPTLEAQINRTAEKISNMAKRQTIIEAELDRWKTGSQGGADRRVDILMQNQRLCRATLKLQRELLDLKRAEVRGLEASVDAFGTAFKSWGRVVVEAKSGEEVSS